MHQRRYQKDEVLVLCGINWPTGIKIKATVHQPKLHTPFGENRVESNWKSQYPSTGSVYLVFKTILKTEILKNPKQLVSPQFTTKTIDSSLTSVQGILTLTN